MNDSLQWHRRFDPDVREERWSLRMPSGLSVTVLPKPGFHRKTGILGFRFGALDGDFEDPETGRTVVVPPGLAHFLEHRLFESEAGDVSERLAAFGASSNAATSYGSTTYFFSGVDHFDACLSILLSFLDGLHVTQDMVDRERRIIAEELRGYQDNPGWVGYNRLMKNLFRESRARHDIGGTLDSIGRIDAALLRQAYGAFYRPANAELVLSGDLDPDAVLAQLGKAERHWTVKPAVARRFDAEPRDIAARASYATMVCSQPLVFLGFKDPRPVRPGESGALQSFETSTLLSILFGRGSDFYRDRYAEGLIDESFHYQVTLEPGLGFTAFHAETDDPHRFVSAVFEELDKARRQGIDHHDFERLRKRTRGRFFKNFNHPETAAFALLQYRLRELDLFDGPAILDGVTKDAMADCLDAVFDPARHALSVIWPAEPDGNDTRESP